MVYCKATQTGELKPWIVRDAMIHQAMQVLYDYSNPG
jgi:hypothetical protein